jgi:hypothetical protein
LHPIYPTIPTAPTTPTSPTGWRFCANMDLRLHKLAVLPCACPTNLRNIRSFARLVDQYPSISAFVSSNCSGNNTINSNVSNSSDSNDNNYRNICVYSNNAYHGDILYGSFIKDPNVPIGFIYFPNIDYLGENKFQLPHFDRDHLVNITFYHDAVAFNTFACVKKKLVNKKMLKYIDDKKYHGLYMRIDY